MSQPASTVETAPGEEKGAGPVTPARLTPRSRTSNGLSSTPPPSGSTAVAQDPPLVALEVSPEDGLIEFIRGPDDRVIAEINKDPNSLGFRKPQREYTYSNGRVVGLTSYRYFADRVEISRTAVSYKPDGSIDEYEESTTYDRAKVKPEGER